MIVGHLGEGIAFVATSVPDACVHQVPLRSLCFFCGGSLELFESPFCFSGQSFSSAFDYKVMKVWEITFLFNIISQYKDTHFYYICDD